MFEKHSYCHLFLYPAFYVLSMNKQKVVHPMINHIHEGSQKVNHEEYNQKPWERSIRTAPTKLLLSWDFF